MPDTVPTTTILDALKWRYATKSFDPTRRIPDDQWRTLESSLVLTPSSFGLQPWHFIVVEDTETRQRLVEHSWGQRQVVDASHLLVIAARTDIDEAWIDRYLARIEAVRGDAGDFGRYRQVMVGFVQDMSAERLLAWAKLQTYIALGQFMAAAALMGIDACPMEGFDRDRYDDLLGLNERRLTASVLCPAGYRSSDDRYAGLPKVRFEDSQMISRI